MNSILLDVIKDGNKSIDDVQVGEIIEASLSDGS